LRDASKLKTCIKILHKQTTLQEDGKTVPVQTFLEWLCHQENSECNPTDTKVRALTSMLSLFPLKNATRKLEINSQYYGTIQRFSARVITTPHKDSEIKEANLYSNVTKLKSRTTYQPTRSISISSFVGQNLMRFSTWSVSNTDPSKARTPLWRQRYSSQ
jgi:hypothetical protein